MEFFQGLWARWSKRIVIFSKWIVFSCLIGAVTGIVGGAFHEAVNSATAYREAHSALIYLLPFAGMVILGLYQLCGLPRDPGTDYYVLVAVRQNDPIRLRIAPLIIISTILTHLFGGSSGREGAALQMGSAISGPARARHAIG